MKNPKESQLLEIVSKLQEQISSLDKKIDILMGRMMATPALMSQTSKIINDSPQSQPKERPMYKIICAECGKESSLPFKPSGGRPVYCKECFTLRKKGVPIKAEDNKPNLAPSLASPPEPEAKPKKKTASAKKVTAKKKVVTKKRK